MDHLDAGEEEEEDEPELGEKLDVRSLLAMSSTSGPIRIPRKISTTTVGRMSRVLSRETIVATAAAQKTRASETRSGSALHARILAGMSEGGQARRLARSTATFTLATGLSRVLGLVREIVAAYFFGVSGRSTPSPSPRRSRALARAFVGDAALSGAFVPVFSELLAKEEKARAWRVASTIFWLVLIGVSALTALLILIAPLLLRPSAIPAATRTSPSS